VLASANVDPMPPINHVFCFVVYLPRVQVPLASDRAPDAGSGAPGGGLLRAGPPGETDELLVELEPDAVVAVDPR